MWETPITIFNLFNHARCVFHGRYCQRVIVLEAMKARAKGRNPGRRK
jgi:hypothetical protein